MSYRKDFPSYDDVQHIDSNAVYSGSNKIVPRTDPNMISYTEMYCQPSACIDPYTAEKQRH